MLSVVAIARSTGAAVRRPLPEAPRHVAARFYESPFTDISPIGPDGLFTSDEVDQMIALLDQVRCNAGAA